MATLTSDIVRITPQYSRGTFGVANNQALVAALTSPDQIILVVGWIAQGSGAAVGTFQLKSASGGTTIMAPLMVPSNAAGACDKLPINESGYGMATTAGQGLFVDITGAGINLTIFYKSYVP